MQKNKLNKKIKKNKKSLVLTQEIALIVFLKQEINLTIFL